MKVKKAIQMLDALIASKKASKHRILSPEKRWNQDEDDFKKFVHTIADNLQREIEWLQRIKRHPLPKQ